MLKVSEESHQEQEELRQKVVHRDHRERARLGRSEARMRREDEL